MPLGVWTAGAEHMRTQLAAQCPWWGQSAWQVFVLLPKLFLRQTLPQSLIVVSVSESHFGFQFYNREPLQDLLNVYPQMCQVLNSVRDSEARSLQSSSLDHVCMPSSIHTKTKYDSSILTVTIIGTQVELEVWIIPVGRLWQTVGRFSLKVSPLLSEHIGRQHSSTFFEES